MLVLDMLLLEHYVMTYSIVGVGIHFEQHMSYEWVFFKVKSVLQCYVFSQYLFTDFDLRNSRMSITCVAF